MRVPIRKGGQYTFIKNDPHMTADKLAQLKKNLQTLKTTIQPSLIKEVKRLSLLGDFSENTEYQIAKGRLRGTNQKILKITRQIASAQIISTPQNNLNIQIGHLVTLRSEQGTQKYRILGSIETNPANGTISHQSPLGSLLINKQVGALVKLKLKNKVIIYEIIKIA